MLHNFLTANRLGLIDRCREKVARRSAPKVTDDELEHGIPQFLDQLIKTLRVERTAEPMESRKVSGNAGGTKPDSSEIGDAATLHGRELSRHGFTVDQVVHDYGDLCQAITDLAFEMDAGIEIDEFRTLNRCLDNAIADAVTEYTYERSSIAAQEHADALTEKLGFFAHELRNLLSTATLSLSALKSGGLPVSGATGAVLDRSLVGMRNLIDRSLAEVRLAAGLTGQQKLFSLAEFVAEVAMSATIEAGSKGCTFTVMEIDPRLAVYADRDLLLSAVGNLLQNAFKFSPDGSRVSMNGYPADDRILIQVEDSCGGLPPGDHERMFLPFVQAGSDKSGLGLGLSIARNNVETSGGSLRVHDVPGTGCIFTIDLPRRALPLANVARQRA